MIDYERQLVLARQVLELDGYRFGSANDKISGTHINTHTGNVYATARAVGREEDVLRRAKDKIERGCRYWRQLDEALAQLLCEWRLAHSQLAACRCCVALIVNQSESPIQLTRIQMLMGKQVTLLGSEATGYEAESRLLGSRGYVVVFLAAFPQSPLEAGHLKAKISSVAFNGVLASTQRETSCEAKGGFTLGFLEKTVSEWWSKYVIHIT